MEQWKKVKDNRVKAVNNDKGFQNTIVKETVQGDKEATMQIQITNQFAILEIE